MGAGAGAGAGAERWASARLSRRGVALAAAVMTGCNLLTGASDLKIGDDQVLERADAQADAGGPGTEGGTASDGGLGFLSCLPGSTFCDDFDAPKGDLSKWTTVATTGGGSARVDGAEAASAPASLVLEWPGSKDVTPSGAYVRKDLALVPQYVQLSLAMKLEAADDSASVSAVQIAFTPGHAISLTFGAGGAARIEEAIALPDGGTSNPSTPLSTGLAVGGAFTKVDISVVVDDRFGAAVVRIDGQEAGTRILTGQAANKPVSLILGDSSVTATSGGWRIRYDDVVVTAR